MKKEQKAEIEEIVKAMHPEKDEKEQRKLVKAVVNEKKRTDVKAFFKGVDHFVAEKIRKTADWLDA